MLELWSGGNARAVEWWECWSCGVVGMLELWSGVNAGAVEWWECWSCGVVGTD